jgi:acetyl-CoA synthetase
VTAGAYPEAAADHLGFWADKAGQLTWDRPWDQVLDWSPAPFAKWFTGGKLNASVNCVDRHVAAFKGQLPTARSDE